MNGIILLGGFNETFKTEAAAAFKKHNISVVRAHGKKSLLASPFAHYTATLRLASRLVKRKNVVITSSWIDVLLRILGASNLDELGLHPVQNATKELNSWIVISRILDRVALRYGALYFIDKGAADIADAAFPAFSSRPDVLVCEKDFNTVEDVVLASTFSRCLHPPTDSMNLNGNIADADYVLVGDKINPYFKHFDHWPFHDDSASSFFITSLLQFIGVPENRLAWTNANHADQGVVELLQRRQPRVIALGREAQRTLNNMGIFPEFSIPHPSWARRFNKRDEYLTSLNSIFKPNNTLSVLASASQSSVSS